MKYSLNRIANYYYFPELFISFMAVLLSETQINFKTQIGFKL